jgi:hypothetical protein
MEFSSALILVSFVNLFRLSTSFLISLDKPFFCKEGIIKYGSVPSGICARLLISNSKDNGNPAEYSTFEIPKHSKENLREEWNRVNVNGSKIECIQVSEDHILRICHLNSKTMFKQSMCRNSGTNFEVIIPSCS